MSIPFLSDALFPQLNANCHSRRHLPLPPTRAPLEMHRLLTVTAYSTIFTPQKYTLPTRHTQSTASDCKSNYVISNNSLHLPRTELAG